MATKIGSIMLLYPSGETRSFIIQKDTPIFYSRFPIGIDTRHYISLRLLHHRYIHPPIPGRHTHLFSQFIHTIYSTTAVATGYYQSFLHPLKWIVYCSNDKLLILILKLLLIEFLSLDKLLDIRRLQATYYDTVFRGSIF